MSSLFLVLTIDLGNQQQLQVDDAYFFWIEEQKKKRKSVCSTFFSTWDFIDLLMGSARRFPQAQRQKT